MPFRQHFLRTAFSSQSLHLICLQEEVDKKIGDLDIMSEIKKPDIYKMNLPADLKKLSTAQCEELCGDIRKILIDTVSKNGGHLASNLGTVELTMAIHRVFESPKDKIVWDVGHQAYTHKILTGRLKEFKTLRQENGISGFCRPDVSVHDAFISGHHSASLLWRSQAPQKQT